jgi:hypothetical protein
VTAEAPTGIAFQQYWDDDEYRTGLRDEIAAVVGSTALADAVMVQVFKRVKLHTWCDRPGCYRSGCGPTHYTFDITTHPRRFADEGGTL